VIEIEEKQIGWSWRKQATLVGVCVACFMLPLDMSVVGVALESIARDLGATFAALQWVINAYNLVFGSLLLTAGALADLFGRRRMFTNGVVIFTTASLLCGFSQGPLMLNVFRAVQGFGAAFVLTSGTAVLANEFRSPSERAKVFGLLGSCCRCHRSGYSGSEAEAKIVVIRRGTWSAFEEIRSPPTKSHWSRYLSRFPSRAKT
jgi:MFS family permease